MQKQIYTPLNLVRANLNEQEKVTHHPSHVFSDRFNSLHRVDGDSVGLLHSQLTPEALLQLSHAEV